MSFSLQPAALKELSMEKLELGGARRCRTAFEHIPNKVLMEILIRLPAKSVMRFKCLFHNFFHKTRQSSRLFMYIVNNEKPSGYMFLSTSPNPDSDKSILSLDHVLDMPVLGGHFVSGIRGLLCLRTERRMQICNLTTKQLVELELPPIDYDDNVWNYFGHDHVRDEYKVLNIVWEFSNDGEKLLRSSEYQVLVLAPQASWRNTQSSFIRPPHLPCTKGISINGVLYYRAQIDRSDTFVVMSFDLTSEEFSLIKCPLDVIPRPALMNYEGKISLFDVFEYSVDIWTLEDAEKSIWSNMKSFVLTISDMDFVSWSRVWRQGTSRSGEVWLGKTNFDRDLFISYDLERNNIIKRIEMNPLFNQTEEAMYIFFWDDMESIMYLET
ncbi:hypothetical protein Bca52824_047993 [Brassica carinata]|uniref:F-box associated beta-propeller type 3 domain-containing protein n=1 Tax=Brassica carinata TaxID=52824 RepID=A0A8X7URQ2_BRACI|nr:hypothetical protein Bca52824_047993 [Brassica carinata]